MAEMLLLIGIGVLLLLLLVTVFALLVYSGLFHSIDIGTGKPPIGETVIAYKYAKGPYRGAGYLFSEVSRVGPSIKKCLGIYYDDPQTVDEYKCRYIVGAILAGENETVDEEVKKNFEEEGFRIFTLPTVTYSIKTTFPYRNTLSIFIAIFRVYPKLTAYVKENRLCAHPFIEIYDEQNIEFMAPLAKQDEFYVEEAKNDAKENENDYDGDDDSFLDESNIDEGSVPRSEGSIPRSEITEGSFLENDDDDGDDDHSDSDVEPDKCIYTEGRKDEVTDVTATPTPPPPQKESAVPGSSTLQDSGFSSEQVATPDPKKTEDENETGSEGTAESGSSFEEIGVDKDNIPSV